jgi:hypothetical protein
LDSAESSITPHPQRIGDTIDVIEPRRNQRDLQNGLIVKADRAQTFVIAGMNLRCVFRDLHDVIQHRALRFGDGRGGVIVFERGDKFLI